MSKSDPDSAIFMEDSVEDVKRKIRDAYCPEKISKDNPILDYTKSIIFASRETFTIERPEKFGGNVYFFYKFNVLVLIILMRSYWKTSKKDFCIPTTLKPLFLEFSTSWSSPFVIISKETLRPKTCWNKLNNGKRNSRNRVWKKLRLNNLELMRKNDYV